MSVQDEIHAQIVGGLAGGKFPIKTPEQLLAAFPDGANTTCKSGCGWDYREPDRRSAWSDGIVHRLQ
ncbi:MAG: hypothetical protein M8353_00395 [ANME-2 cluster archaeon]|nr:hypothetical protein [ANME-2 cluster archaeon]